MVRAVVLAALLLGKFTCSYSRTDTDGDTKTRIEVVSNPLLAGPVPAWLHDADGDGQVDLLTAERWFLLRDAGFEETEPLGPVPPDPPSHLARVEDVDADGRIDRIFVDGVLLRG